jgi:cytoskeleton protein RodZ
VSKSFEETDDRVTAFGERLRRERELRGISLEDICAVTKIGTRLLRALEAEHFDLLPGGIFNKGYVRAYARHLGIDEEQAVADYLKAAHETPPDVRLIAHQNSSARADHITSHASYRGGFPLLPVLILLVVIVGAAGGWQLYQQRQGERRQTSRTQEVAAQPSSAQTTNFNPSSNSAPGQAGSSLSGSSSDQSIASPTLPNSTAASNGAVHTVEAAESSPPSRSEAASAAGSTGPEGGAQFEITVRVKDRAWVEIKSDGKILLQGVMNPTDVKTIHATNKVVFWTGNAGVVELSFNGKNVPLNGGENDEQVLVFNSHGLLPRPATQ